jgi:hypothetical protein
MLLRQTAPLRHRGGWRGAVQLSIKVAMELSHHHHHQSRSTPPECTFCGGLGTVEINEPAGEMRPLQTGDRAHPGQIIFPCPMCANTRALKALIGGAPEPY